MSPFKKLPKRDDQLSSYGVVVVVVDNVALPLALWPENVFYRNIRQWASNGHLVTVEANRHRLPNLLSNCGNHRQEVTYTTWLINDDDVLTASTHYCHSHWNCDTASHWHWPNRFTTGRVRGRGRNWPVLENSCKNIMGLVICTW